MRIIIFICLVWGYTTSHAQDLSKKLEKIVSSIDMQYEKVQPYSVIVDVVSSSYKENQVIQESKEVEQYKMVMGKDFTYTYFNTTQVFRDSVGELIINNQKRLIEFNTFRTLSVTMPGQSIMYVAKEFNVNISEVKHIDDKTVLLFTNELGDIEIEFQIVNNQIIESVHRNLNESKNREFTLQTKYKNIKPNLLNIDKYRIKGNGRVVNEEFIPNAKYTEYEIFNY